MEVNELPSPMFVTNEEGRLTVFLPAFDGEPEKPVLTKKDEKTLHFQRSASGDCLLTEIPEEVMEALTGVNKMLVVESNVMKSIDIAEKVLDAAAKQKESPIEGMSEEEMMDIIERAYEVQVNI